MSFPAGVPVKTVTKLDKVKHDRDPSHIPERLFGLLRGEGVFLVVQLRAVQYGWEEWLRFADYAWYLCQQDQVHSCGNLICHSRRDHHNSGCGSW